MPGLTATTRLWEAKLDNVLMLPMNLLKVVIYFDSVLANAVLVGVPKVCKDKKVILNALYTTATYLISCGALNFRLLTRE